MKKRTISLILAATTAALAFAGCGKTEKGATDEIPTLKWYVPGSHQNGTAAVMEEFNKISVEKIGAKLDLSFVDNGSYSERMKLNMASGDDYDLCFTGYLNKYDDAVKNGGLYCMDELLEKHPKLKESVEDYAWQSATYNGKIYAVPNMQIQAKANCVMIQKKFVDKYNFDTSKVEKITDIEPLLKQIKENETGVYPYRPNYGLSALTSKDTNSAIDSKDILKTENGISIVRENGKVVAKYEYEVKDHLKGAEIMRDWFNKGYIRSDVASVMEDNQEKLAGLYASWVETYKPGVEQEFKNNSGIEVVSLRISEPAFDRTSINSTMIGIGVNSKYPEKAMAMIELVNTDVEAYNLLCYGIEGVHYNKIGENRIEPVEGSDYNPNASWKFGNQFNAYLLPEQADDVWEETKAMNKEAEVNEIFGFIFDNSAVKAEIAAYTDVISRYPARTNGSEEPSTYFDQLKSDLDEIGIEKIRLEYQKQVDEFLAK